MHGGEAVNDGIDEAVAFRHEQAPSTDLWTGIACDPRWARGFYSTGTETNRWLPLASSTSSITVLRLLFLTLSMRLAMS
jgi:hypothetical protein